MEIELFQLILDLITLILGCAMIVYIYQAYNRIRQGSLLILMYAIFVLIIGIILPDFLIMFSIDTFWSFWLAIFSKLLVILGLCTMIYSVVRG